MKKILSLIGIVLLPALLAALGTLAFVKSRQTADFERQLSDAVRVAKDQQGRMKELQVEVQGLQEALRQANTRVAELQQSGASTAASALTTGTSPAGGLALACPSGKSAAPSAPTDPSRQTLEMKYKPTALRILNNGQSVQIAGSPDSVLKVGAEVYELVSIHFHRPESGLLDGKPVAMLAHFIHRDAKGRVVVVSAPLRESAFQNRTLWNISNHLPTRGAPESAVANVTVDPMSLLPENLSYQTVDGALPMPPCTEGVRFYRLKTPVGVGKEQIERLQAAVTKA